MIRKFFLHVSHKEQEKRFRERLERPEKNWKFSPADLKERGIEPKGNSRLFTPTARLKGIDAVHERDLGTQHGRQSSRHARPPGEHPRDRIQLRFEHQNR
jgi:hypothetical protein